MKQAKTKKASAEKKKKRGEKGQNKKEKKLRVLILEDNPVDAELMERQLKKDGIDFDSRRVDTRSEFLKALQAFKPDLILSDYNLPKFNALQALELRNKMAPLTQFIVVTGSISEEIAVQCIKQGADDYLLKDRLARLAEAVRHSLANRRLQAEKIAAEEALHEMNEIFRMFLKHNPIYVFFKDENIRPVYLSENFERMLGLPLGEILGKSMDELFPSELSRSMIEDDKRILREGKPFEFIEELNDRIYSTLKFPILIEGKAKYLAGYTTDITERKRAEEQIRASLLEKEILLKEIHHRVKNNLQVISGLLTLQAAQIGDERLQRVLKESQSRIWTMALIHQTLYQTGNLADIDMADYIRSLAGNLLSSHARVAMPPTIIFNLLPLRLVIDKAIPLALIINELVTNTMKHAFPDGQPGEIRIALQERRGVKFYALPEESGTDTGRGVKFYAPTEDMGTALRSDRSRPVTTNNTGTARRAPTDMESAPTYELTVADNGIGLPSGFDLKKQKSLGLQLVTMLARQLDGKLTIESKGGTAVTITFNNNEKN